MSIALLKKLVDLGVDNVKNGRSRRRGKIRAFRGGFSQRLLLMCSNSTGVTVLFSNGTAGMGGQMYHQHD
jgi:hypothetical protein